MPQASLESIASDPLFSALPLIVEQRSSRISALILLCLLVPALVGLVLPVWFLAVFAVPALWIAAENPGAALQVLGGLAVWTGLFVVPAMRLLERFRTSRTVSIGTAMVSVRERRLVGERSWMVPLLQFTGVTHIIRTSLSGLHHELILVHNEPRRCIVLHRADRISQTTIDRAAQLLSLPQVPASELYRFAQRWPRAVRRWPAAQVAGVPQGAPQPT